METNTSPPRTMRTTGPCAACSCSRYLQRPPAWWYVDGSIDQSISQSGQSVRRSRSIDHTHAHTRTDGNGIVPQTLAFFSSSSWPRVLSVRASGPGREVRRWCRRYKAPSSRATAPPTSTPSATFPASSRARPPLPMADCVACWCVAVCVTCCVGCRGYGRWLRRASECVADESTQPSIDRSMNPDRHSNALSITCCDSVDRWGWRHTRALIAPGSRHDGHHPRRLGVGFFGASSGCSSPGVTPMGRV